MAVTAVKEKRQSRSSSSDARHRSYTRVYQVILDDPTNGEAIALTASFGGDSVPDQGDQHDTDTFARVVNKSTASRGDDGLVYDVTVNWDTDYKRAGFQLIGGSGQSAFNDPPTFVENPLIRPPSITFRNDITAEEMHFDLNDKKVKNSAGKPFDPAPLQDKSRYTWVIERNQTEVSVAALYALNNTINTTAISIGDFSHPKETLKLTISTTGVEYDGGWAFWPITYELQYKPEGWQPKIVNRGWQCFRTANDDKPTYPPVFDNAGVEIEPAPAPPEPVFLAADGTLLPEGDDPTYAVPDGGGDYKTYETFEFSGLGFSTLFSSDIFS
ncbi:MAG: hypothetical protein DHS20C16_03590 [Phycisphaerae bacterium]|nr:MAG: hypothetical protein DHS20C16_03590 [Phycisphaerae bacterium]